MTPTNINELVNKGFTDTTYAIKANPTSGQNNYAPIASPTFTGTPLLTTTPTAGDASQQIANTAFVSNAISTLNSGLSYAPLASPIFSGIPTTPTA